MLSDTSSALDILASLSESFKLVELETTAFQAQCEDLLAEQKRLRDLADEVGTDLQYYAYLEPLTRRLNAPGAGRLVRSDDFLDMLLNLNTCIDFMDDHVSLRVALKHFPNSPKVWPPSAGLDTDYDSQIIETPPLIRLATLLC